MFRVGRIFGVDNETGNHGCQAVEESAESVEIHVAEEFQGEIKPLRLTVSRKTLVLDNNYLKKSKYALR